MSETKIARIWSFKEFKKLLLKGALMRRRDRKDAKRVLTSTDVRTGKFLKDKFVGDVARDVTSEADNAKTWLEQQCKQRSLIEDVTNDKQTGKIDAAICFRRLLEVYQRFDRHVKFRSQKKEIGALWFYTYEDLFDEESFWGLWWFFHGLWETKLISNFYDTQHLAFTRNARRDRGFEFIADAGKRVFEAASFLDWGAHDLFMGNAMGVEFKMDERMIEVGQRRYERSMKFINQYEDEDEITVYRGFFVREGEYVREGKQLRLKDGSVSETAFQQDAGRGTSYTTDRGIADWFAVHRPLRVQSLENENIQERRKVVAEYRVKAKDVLAFIDMGGEDEVVALGENVRVKNYEITQKRFTQAMTRNTELYWESKKWESLENYWYTEDALREFNAARRREKEKLLKAKQDEEEREKKREKEKLLKAKQDEEEREKKREIRRARKSAEKEQKKLKQQQQKAAVENSKLLKKKSNG